MRKAHLLVAASLVLFAFHLNAQYAFVLPNGGTSGVTVFTLSPFTQIGGFNATTSAFEVLTRSDGGEFYVISNSSTNTVITANSLLGNVTSLIGFGTGASNAIRTPDGQKIVVAAGNIYVVNVANDSLAVPSGISVGGTALDVAASIDSTQAYVLVNTGSAYQLVDVDLRLFQAGKTLAISGTPTGVVVGPNGLIYVGTTNALLEIDPTTLTIRNTITANGTPGKLTFTPNGKLGVAPNVTPSTGTAVFVFNMALKTAVTPPITTTTLPFAISQVFVVSDNQAYAFSSASQSLSIIQLGTLAVSNFQAAPSGVVSFAAVTGDLSTTNATPAGSHATTKYLLFVSGGILYEYDIANTQIVGQSAISGTVGALSIATPANNGFPVGVLAYGDQQTFPTNVASAPLAVRAIDSNGKPVVGVGVNFTTTTNGVTIQTPSVLTNTDGLASTTITATVAGAVQVSAQAGSGLSYTFNLNAGSGSGNGGGGGGGTGGTASALTIISGQGVIVPSGSDVSTVFATLGSTYNGIMGVKYTDTNGNPVVGATITFNETSGGGALLCPSSATEVFTCTTTLSSLTISTDINGNAFSDFQGGTVDPSTGTAFSQATITASAPNGSVVTFYETSINTSQPPTTRPVQGLASLSNTPLTGSAGQTLTGSQSIQVQVASYTGAPIPNVSLYIVAPPNPAKGPSASCAPPAPGSGPFALSDATGLATCNPVLAGLSGSTTLTAEVGYEFDYNVNISVMAGVPSKVNIISGNNQSAKPGTTLPASFIVQVADASGNPLPGTPVAWKVVSGTLTLSQVVSTTDSTGKASALGILGNTPGTATVTATAGSATATFTVTITTPPVPITSLTVVSGNSQSAAQNAAFANPLVVKLADANGNPVANQTVTFAVTSGSATLGTASATSNASGQASTTVTAGATAGTVVITASSNGLSTTFTLTIIPPGPSNVVFLNGASFFQLAAAGAIVTIQGTGIASGVTGVVLADNIIGPLPTTLAGVSITFNGTPAPIFSVSNVNGVQQVTVQVPYEVAGLSTASVVINTPGGGTGTFTVNLKPYSPGIFTTNVFGVPNYIVATRPDGSYVSPTNAAHRGEVILIYVTGLGQTNPLTGTNEAGIANQNIVATIAVGFNNAGYPFISAQTVPGLIGVYAIAIQVGSDVTPGAQIPVGLIAYDLSGNAIFANTPVISIQ